MQPIMQDLVPSMRSFHMMWALGRSGVPALTVVAAATPAPCGAGSVAVEVVI